MTGSADCFCCAKEYQFNFNPLLHNKNYQRSLSCSVMKQLRATLSNYLVYRRRCVLRYYGQQYLIWETIFGKVQKYLELMELK